MSRLTVEKTDSTLLRLWYAARYSSLLGAEQMEHLLEQAAHPTGRVGPRICLARPTLSGCVQQTVNPIVSGCCFPPDGTLGFAPGMSELRLPGGRGQPGRSPWSRGCDTAFPASTPRTRTARRSGTTARLSAIAERPASAAP